METLIGIWLLINFLALLIPAVAIFPALILSEFPRPLQFIFEIVFWGFFMPSLVVALIISFIRDLLRI